MVNSKKSISREKVDEAALKIFPALAKRWLPEGELRGHHWVARNPTRDDLTAGSFKIDLRTGSWRDWATGERGRGAVSLAAYIAGMSAANATAAVANMLELSDG